MTNRVSVDIYLRLSKARVEARMAIGALYSSVGEPIADDVREKVEAAFEAYEHYIAAPESATKQSEPITSIAKTTSPEAIPKLTSLLFRRWDRNP